jgi:hypothetical protein
MNRLLRQKLGQGEVRSLSTPTLLSEGHVYPI